MMARKEMELVSAEHGSWAPTKRFWNLAGMALVILAVGLVLHLLAPPGAVWLTIAPFIKMLGVIFVFMLLLNFFF